MHKMIIGRNRVFKKKLGFKNHILLRWIVRAKRCGRLHSTLPLKSFKSTWVLSLISCYEPPLTPP